jgi:hypothetical protein
MTRSTTGVATAGLILCLTSGVYAQTTIINTNGVIVANVGEGVPDANGNLLPGYTFGGTGNFDSPTLDEAGNVYFRGRFSEASVLPYNDRAYFYGSSRSNLRMAVRGGDQAPSLPTGVLLRTTTGTTVSLSSSNFMTSNGSRMFGATFWDSVGTNGITSANDEGFFGNVGSGPLQMLIQQGTPAPGTVGATFAQAFSSFSQQNNGINNEGRIFFLGSLTGGDVVTTAGANNQSAWFAGLPGALEMVQRKGSPVAAIPGAIALDTVSTLGFVSQMTPDGRFLYEIAMSTTQGTATVATDKAYLVHTPGAGSQVLLREGDVAPGTSGATYNAATGDSWSAGLPAQGFSKTGKVHFTSTLRGGDVVGTTNDTGIFYGPVGGLQLVARRGAAAPGTDATFGVFNNANCKSNDNGAITIQASLVGGTSTTADDSGVWSGLPGALQLVVREGQVMPGTGGGLAGAFSGTSVYMNDQNRVMFTTNLTGGTYPGTSWWFWDPTTGLTAISFNNQPVEVSPGVFKNIQSVNTNSFNNSGGATLMWNHNGTLGLKLGFTDGTGLIMVVPFPGNTLATGFCSGDGVVLNCPCGNNGAAGNGCANSINASGGNLAGSGIASLSADSFTLNGAGMPNSSALYFQGTTQTAVAFGDGLRCAAGSVVRLGAKFNTGGTSQYPAAGDASISVRAGITAPGSLYYQCWYRNADPAFCTAAVFNLSNGVAVTWVP